ncbi:hypothetical protein VB005_02151 [Metarhizium brunneum]
MAAAEGGWKDMMTVCAKMTVFRGVSGQASIEYQAQIRQASDVFVELWHQTALDNNDAGTQDFGHDNPTSIINGIVASGRLTLGGGALHDRVACAPKRSQDYRGNA